MKTFRSVLWLLLLAVSSFAQTHTEMTLEDAQTAIGAKTLKTLEQVVYIDPGNPQGWSGSDFGAWANSAYAALGASGGRIHVSCGAYSFSTPVVFNTVNKQVILEGDGRCTALSFTGGSGTTAFTYDNFGSLQVEGGGMRDIYLDGGSINGQTGILLAQTNGCVACVFDRITVNHFATPFSIPAGNKVFFVTLKESHIGQGTTGLNIAASGLEEFRIVDTAIYQNVTGLSFSGATSEILLYGDSFDDNTANGVNQSAGHIYGSGNHFENLNLGTSQYVTITGGDIALIGGIFNDDVTSGTNAQMISASGSSSVVLEDMVLFSLGRTTTQLVNFSGTAQGFLSPVNTFNPALFPADYNVAYAGGKVMDLPLRNDSGTTTARWQNFQSIFDGAQSRTNSAGSSAQTFSICDTAGANCTYLRKSSGTLQFLNGAFSTVQLSMFDGGGMAGPGTQQFARIKANQGTALTTSNFGSPSGGWGTTASKSSATGFDQAGTIVIASSGTGQAANPTIVLTFADGTWSTIPTCTAGRTEVNVPTSSVSASATATALTLTFAGTPVAGTSYTMAWTCMGN